MCMLCTQCIYVQYAQVIHIAVLHYECVCVCVCVCVGLCAMLWYCVYVGVGAECDSVLLRMCLHTLVTLFPQ